MGQRTLNEVWQRLQTMPSKLLQYINMEGYLVEKFFMLSDYFYKVSGSIIFINGSVPQDFWLQVFFMNQFPHSLLGPLQIFHKFSKIFEAQGAPPLSSGGDAPPVSTTPAANFATGTAVIVIVNL